MARWPKIEISRESVIEALVRNHYLILSTSKELGIGRGIIMCDQWLESFNSFFEHTVSLDHSFEEGYSIDRINVNGDYEPANIRFLTSKEQMNNTRVNRTVEWEGTKYTLTQFAEKFGLAYDFVRDRLNLGFTLREVITIPAYKKRSKDKVSLVSKGTRCIEAWYRLEGTVKKRYFYYSNYKDKTLLAAKEWLLLNSGFSKEDVQKVVRELEHKLLDKDVPYQLL